MEWVFDLQSAWFYTNAMGKKKNYGLYAIVILILAVFLGYSLYSTGKGQKNLGFKLGLDLSGGTELLYKADVSRLSPQDINSSLEALRNTIERRINAFGVAEPVVQLEKGSALDKDAKYRLIVELPGVSDTAKAIEILGKTPVLEFRMQKAKQIEVGKDGNVNIDTAPEYGEALLTGAHLKRAVVDASGQNGIGQIQVILNFNSEGKDLFAKLTKENVGKVFGIFLDGQVISAPVIQEAITGGTAVITGNFNLQEAQDLVRNLNFGALPVPIELLSSQTIGASLGQSALQKGLQAFVWGLLAVMLFMVFWYRLPGVAANLALGIYIIIMLAIFKWMPVTLTVAGIAGFILSLGMAVDANVLIFERMKEELNKGKSLKDSVETGFNRAWSSIRDGNISSLLTAVILFWFGTALIKGFALVFALGVIVSMFSAIAISRTFLLAVVPFFEKNKKARRWFKCGIK